MTFMRKFMDILNMDNWKEHGTHFDFSTKNSSDLSKMKNTIFLQEIRYFWRIHPQSYQNNYQDASIKEYILYAKTLLLWLFEKASPLITTFPIYFERECHISNPQKLQSELLHDSYIVPAPLSAILNAYKMQELKIIADSLGCAKSGKKAELINRIYQNLSESMANSIISGSNLFTLSDIGRSFLHSNYDYVELHRHSNYDISLYDFNKNRFSGNHKRSFADNAYTLIRQKIYKNSSQYYYHMMEYDYIALYNIALSEHEIDIALDCYLRALYLRSCCIRTAQYYATNFYHLDFNENSETLFTIHSASPIAELGKFYNTSYIENIYNDKSLPPSFLTKHETIDMIKDMISNTVFDYEKYNRLIISRLQTYSKL